MILALFEDLVIPLNHSKTEGPTYCLTYLGVQLALEARLPQAKLDRIVELLEHFISRSSYTKQQPLSLLGHLAFAGKVVSAGRTFVARLLELSTTVSHLHHVVTLSTNVKDDLHMWLTLLQQWNGISVFHDDPITSNDLTLFTDSSSSVGFGAYYKSQNQFIMDTWGNHPLHVSKHQMSLLELYPIVVSAIVWGSG